VGEEGGVNSRSCGEGGVGADCGVDHQGGGWEGDLASRTLWVSLDKLLKGSHEEGEGGKRGATAPPGLTVRLTDTFPVSTFAADAVDGAEVDMDAACGRAIPRPHAVPDGADNDEAAAAAVAAAAASPPLRRQVPLVRGASGLLDAADV